MSDNRRYLIFRLVFFFIQMPVAVLMPYFFLHLREVAGMTIPQISYVSMVTGVAILLTQQGWGYLADVHISKRRLIWINSLLASLVFLAIAPFRSFGAILVGFFIYQILNTPIVQLLHGFLFIHPNSHHRFGLLRAWGSLGFVVANIGIGFAADKITGGNIGFIFPLMAILSMTGASLLMLLPELPPMTGTRPTFMQVQSFFFRRPEVAAFLGVVLLYQAAHSFSYTVQSFLMRDMGADKGIVGMSYSLAALMELPFFFAANRILRRFGELRVIAFAAVVQAIRWMLVWNATGPGEVVLISSLHGITFGCFYVSAVSYMNRHAGPQYKASAQTLVALAYFGVAQLAGNFLGGMVAGDGWVARVVAGMVTFIGLADRGPLRNLYIFSAALALLAAVFAMLLLRHENRANARLSTCT
jgi:PPP family 3-phenylpropionic acid transporter